jgi:hypothetical protein
MDIIVEYSLEKDIWNYLHALYKFSWLKHGRNEIQEKLLAPFPTPFKNKLKQAKDEEGAKQIVKKYLSENLGNRQLRYQKVAGELKTAWLENKRQVESRLEEIYQEKIPFETLTIYLSTLPISPYNFKEKWIIVYGEASRERQIQITVHELNHFLFYHFYYHWKEKLGTENFESLKEALTVFTNPEEKGYPKEAKLRSWLKNQKASIPEIIQQRKWEAYL